MVYHSLCVYTGGWPAPKGVPENDTYWWLGHLISGFRIETIAFVGGYVFCFQCFELGKRRGFFSFLWKKFQRLIIPCFIFGIIYYFLFRYHGHFRFNIFFWRVANGIGHLWFLPMLFWCFLACWLLDRLLKWLNEKHDRWFLPVGWTLLVALCGVSLITVNGLRLGLTRAPFFLFYFYLGYWVRMMMTRREKKTFSVAVPVVLWLLYLIFVIVHQQTTHAYLPGCSFRCPNWLCGFSQLSLKLLALGHTVCGIMALYTTVMLWLARHKSADAQPGPFLRECSRLCYGVYVFHMFFMQPIYFHCGFPQWCCGSALGVWVMPWLVLVVTLGLCVLVTWLLLKTRFGRFLIG